MVWVSGIFTGPDLGLVVQMAVRSHLVHTFDGVVATDPGYTQSLGVFRCISIDMGEHCLRCFGIAGGKCEVITLFHAL